MGHLKTSANQSLLKEATVRECLSPITGDLKDPMTGLIDFYTWVDGELAFLCWQHGEDSIEYWHGIEEGYRGRKPVSDSPS